MLSEGQGCLKVNVVWMSRLSEGQCCLKVKVVWRSRLSEGQGIIVHWKNTCPKKLCVWVWTLKLAPSVRFFLSLDFSAHFLSLDFSAHLDTGHAFHRFLTLSIFCYTKDVSYKVNSNEYRTLEISCVITNVGCCQQGSIVVNVLFWKSKAESIWYKSETFD